MYENLPVFLEYDEENSEKELVNLFEEKTGKTLYPAQDERLLLSIIAYKASLLVNSFNDSARLNLTQFSRGELLDYIGEMFDTPRLMGEKGTDILEVKLNTTFTYDLIIPEGLQVLSKDEKYLFLTVEDLIIPKGELTGTVKIKSEKIGEEVNMYGAGDVNYLVRPVSYIDSVTNINGIKGGANVENDDAYRKRILLSPEKFSCAGSRQSYIYHTLSANTKIIDASVESVEHKATITINSLENNEISDSTTYTENNNIITTPDFTAQVNHKSGEFKFSLNDKEYIFKITPDTTVNIYPLTDEDTTSQDILDDVENLLNGENINPLTDKIVAISPQKITQIINMNITLTEDANREQTTKEIYSITNEYKETMKSKLHTDIIPSQIISKIGNIDGVYAVNIDIQNTISANINEYFDINFQINIQ